MEDVTKTIEIAVGVILFIIAVTIAILNYSKFNKVTKDSLSINNMENSVVYSTEDMNEYVYTKQDIYFLLKDIIRQSDTNQVDADNNMYKELTTVKIDSVDISKSSISSVVNNINNYLGDVNYKVEYEFKYIKGDNKNVNSHLPTKIIITRI